MFEDDLIVRIIAEYCSANELRSLSCSNMSLNRIILNSSISIFCAEFMVRMDDPRIHIPRNRDEIYKLIDRVRWAHSTNLFIEVFLYACCMRLFS